MSYFNNTKNLLLVIKGEKGEPGTIGKSIQAVLTAEEMDDIRTGKIGGTEERFYIYIGETTPSPLDNSITYKKGAFYRAGEVETDG